MSDVVKLTPLYIWFAVKLPLLSIDAIHPTSLFLNMKPLPALLLMLKYIAWSPVTVPWVPYVAVGPKYIP